MANASFRACHTRENTNESHSTSPSAQGKLAAAFQKEKD
jgi:hypothetical protein